jgi:hypothetical protein
MRLKECDGIEIEAALVGRMKSISSWHIKQWTQNWMVSSEEEGGSLEAGKRSVLGLSGKRRDPHFWKHSAVVGPRPGRLRACFTSSLLTLPAKYSRDIVTI